MWGLWLVVGLTAWFSVWFSIKHVITTTTVLAALSLTTTVVGGGLLFHSGSSPPPPQSPIPPLPPPDGDPVSRRPLLEAPGTGWASYSEQRLQDTDSMLSFQTFFFFVFLRIVVPRRLVRSSAVVVVVPRRSVRSISVAAITAVVPHSASDLTFTQQRAGGGAGGDANGGVAAAEATYRRQRMHGLAKGGGGRAQPQNQWSNKKYILLRVIMVG